MALLDFIHELGKIGGYLGLIEAIYRTWLSLPMTLYEVLPMAVLIGGLVGIGNLSSQNELIAAQAIGYSQRNMIYFILGPKMILFFVLIMLAMSEVAVPLAENKLLQWDKQESFQSLKNDLWTRNKNSFIHIGQSFGESSYKDVTFYEYNRKHGHLDAIIQTKSMRVEGDQLLLDDLDIAQLNENSIDLLTLKSKTIPQSISLERSLFDRVSPVSLNFMQLMGEIKLLGQSRLNADIHQLVLWKRFSAILSIFAMLVIAIPLVFGNNRVGTLGKRLFYGVILGLIYTIIDKFIGNFFIIQQLPIWLGAFLTPTLFLFAGFFQLRR